MNLEVGLRIWGSGTPETPQPLNLDMVAPDVARPGIFLQIILLMDKILHDPIRTLNYGNYGIFLIMGNAGFCPSTVLGILL